MVHLEDPGIDEITTRTLKQYQANVDAAGHYASRIAAARTLFERRNTTQNATFRVVRTQLSKMCASPHRCGWCEDSEANQIDHIRPKALYPQRTFVWENYLPACGVCNNGKGDRFAIMSDGGMVDVTRHRGDSVVPPRSGDPALVDPRFEDPLEFLELEPVNTFRFLPKYGLTFADRHRAKYTIHLLKLNRDALTIARRNVYDDNRARLTEFREVRDDGASDAELEMFKARFLCRPHPTVWREMQRQHELPGLKELFRDVPEALTW